MRQVGEYLLMNAVAVKAIESSTNATPIVVTITGHGLSTGDRITINGHETNTSANGTWVITKVNANSFSLDDSVGVGVGGATGIVALASKIALADDFRNAILEIAFASTPTMTVKIVGSTGKSATDDGSPDFAKDQTADNMYEFLNAIDLEDGASISGDTGISVSGTADTRTVEVNINAMRWISILPTAGSAGAITAKLRLYSNT